MVDEFQALPSAGAFVELQISDFSLNFITQKYGEGEIKMTEKYMIFLDFGEDSRFEGPITNIFDAKTILF